jgi:prepilin-type N-terminal cleavage/methylation domain-containing protein
MNGRRHWGQRVRPGLTLVELLVAIAVLGLLEALLLTAGTPAPDTQPPPLAAAEQAPPDEPIPPAAPPQPGRELSLQETLDRLGFTVNVPRVYDGRRLANWGAGRVSTRSDEAPTGWFEANGLVRFVEVSRQSDLGPVTTFAAETPGGDPIEVFRPMDLTSGDPLALGRSRYRRSTCPSPAGVFPNGNRTARRVMRGTYRLWIDFPPNSFTRGPLYSTSEENPGGAAHLLVLPARKGGRWVEERKNTGHWQGGVRDGGYLLCWEDTVRGDDDFQDLVVYVRGIRPARR